MTGSMIILCLEYLLNNQIKMLVFNCLEYMQLEFRKKKSNDLDIKS